MTSIKKTEKKNKSKKLTLRSCLMSSEPRPRNSFNKIKNDLIDIFINYLCNFLIPNTLNYKCMSQCKEILETIKLFD